MSHADTLRTWAKQYITPAAREPFLAGADALDTLAADHLEYCIEHQHIDNGVWHPVTKWSTEWPLHEGHTVAPDERIVCRRVSEPWKVTNE